MRDAGRGMRDAGCGTRDEGRAKTTGASRVHFITVRPASRARLLLLFRLLTMLDDIAGLEEDVLKDLPP